jgi:peroxiredoxin
MKTEIIPSYREGLQQLRVGLTQMLPPAALKTLDDYAEELDASTHNILKIKTGDTAPNFTLNNQTGNTVSLSGVLEKGKVVLGGGWCPYCNLQLSQLQGSLDEIKNHNANLIAISPQAPDSSLSMTEKSNLQFEVLSDIVNLVARKFTTVFRHADKATAVLNSLGVDFEGHYGDDSNELPVPAVFVIDRNGKVLFAKSDGGDFRNRVELSDILESLQ